MLPAAGAEPVIVCGAYGEPELLSEMVTVLY